MNCKLCGAKRPDQKKQEKQEAKLIALLIEEPKPESANTDDSTQAA